MTKKTRSTSRTEETQVPLDPVPMAEPTSGPLGDLPDAASENAVEPSMPEAAKEVPGMSDAATAAAPAMPWTKEKSSSTDNEPVADDSDDTVKLDDASPENDTQESIPDEVEKYLDHDTQELEDDEVDLSDEDTPRVEDVKKQDRKRPVEEVENDEVSPAKIMSGVNTDAPVETIRGEE